MSEIKLSCVKKGIACFTFDDRNFDGWINAMSLFKKYDAKASFFISGDIDGEAIRVISVLKENGHTVGLHTVHHMDAPEYFAAYGGEMYFKNEIEPQLMLCARNGFEIRSFAYPNNLQTEETNSYLEKYFDRFRTGKRNASDEEIFVPVDKLSENTVMMGRGIGEYYNTDEIKLIDILENVSKTNTCVTFFSHNIEPHAKSINMPIELLEKCLDKSSKLGVKLLGFDDL